MSEQTRSIDASLRLLVENASHDPDGRYRAQRDQQACYFFMRDKAGDRPNFDEASRALFANDWALLQALVAQWPPEHAREVMERAGQARLPTAKGL